jgi:hypothetical protein
VLPSPPRPASVREGGAEASPSGFLALAGCSARALSHLRASIGVSGEFQEGRNGEETRVGRLPKLERSTVISCSVHQMVLRISYFIITGARPRGSEGHRVHSN